MPWEIFRMSAFHSWLLRQSWYQPGNSHGDFVLAMVSCGFPASKDKYPQLLTLPGPIVAFQRLAMERLK